MLSIQMPYSAFICVFGATVPLLYVHVYTPTRELISIVPNVSHSAKFVTREKTGGIDDTHLAFLVALVGVKLLKCMKLTV